MKLKPCPFCGGKAKWLDTGNSCFPYQIVCESCFCGTDINHRKDILLERWNRREPIDKIVEQLEAEIESSDKYIAEYDDSEVQKAWNVGMRKCLEIVKGGAE